MSLTKKEITLLERYVEDHYIPDFDDDVQPFDFSPNEMCGSVDLSDNGKFGLHQSYNQDELDSLIKYSDERDKTFSDALIDILNRKGLSEPDVYNKIDMQRQTFNKIKNSPKCHPKKDTVILLCFGLKLNLEESNDFLQKAEYAFSPSKKRDLVIMYFLEHRMHSVKDLNSYLFKKGYASLGTSTADN